jgi:molybdopterin-containing oxidoreductase family membrane subunit
VLAFAGIWIEKGMGLIVPGFIPSPIGEVTEYYPTFIEVADDRWASGRSGSSS